MSDLFHTLELGDGSRPTVSITIGGYVNDRSGAMRMNGYLVKTDSRGGAWWYDAPVTFEGGPFDTYGEALQYVLDYLVPHIKTSPRSMEGGESSPSSASLG